MSEESQWERINCPNIAHPVVLAVVHSHTQKHTHSTMGRQRMSVGVVRGPEKGEGKHLVTPLFLTKLLEVRRQQEVMSWTAALIRF